MPTRGHCRPVPCSGLCWCHLLLLHEPVHHPVPHRAPAPLCSAPQRPKRQEDPRAGEPATATSSCDGRHGKRGGLAARRCVWGGRPGHGRPERWADRAGHGHSRDGQWPGGGESRGHGGGVWSAVRSPYAEQVRSRIKASGKVGPGAPKTSNTTLESGLYLVGSHRGFQVGQGRNKRSRLGDRPGAGVQPGEGSSVGAASMVRAALVRGGATRETKGVNTGWDTGRRTR